MGCIGTLRRILSTRPNSAIEICERQEKRALRSLLVTLPPSQGASSETRNTPRVAGRTSLLHQRQQSISVTVIAKLPNMLNVTGSLSLVPKAPSRTTVEPGSAEFQGPFQGLPVHVANISTSPVVHSWTTQGSSPSASNASSSNSSTTTLNPGTGSGKEITSPSLSGKSAGRFHLARCDSCPA